MKQNESILITSKRNEFVESGLVVFRAIRRPMSLRDNRPPMRQQNGVSTVVLFVAGVALSLRCFSVGLGEYPQKTQIEAFFERIFAHSRSLGQPRRKRGRI
jgi:hypothetical protein